MWMLGCVLVGSVLPTRKSEEPEQGAAVPVEVEQYVKVIQGVLVKQVSLIEDEDGVDAVLAQVLDLGGDGVEQRGGGTAGGQAQGDGELAIEVAAPQGDVGAVGEAKLLGGQRGAHGAQQAGLARAGLAIDRGVLSLAQGGRDLLQEQQRGRRQV